MPQDAERRTQVSSTRAERRPSSYVLRDLLLRLLALVARRFVVRPAPEAPRRILVIKPDHLGDVLLATPALGLLRAQHPQAAIVALVGPWSAFMLARNPAVDVVLTLPFPGFERRAAGRSARHEAPTAQVAKPHSSDSRPPSTVHRPSSIMRPYTTLLRYAALLRAGGFDCALLLRDDHWWGAALALLAGIPRRVGHAVPACRPFLSDALPWNPHEHVAAQALATVNALNGRPLTQLPLSSGNQIVHRPSPIVHPLHFAPSPADLAWARDWCAQHLAADARLLVLHPGTGGPAKLWLPARWAALADELAALPGVRVLLTGGPGEEALVAAIAAQAANPPLTLVGTMQVGQLAALLGQAALVLGVDSGPLHLAVSQGTPSIHLFGPSDAARFGPWGDPTRHVVLRAGLWCSPCGVFNACPRGTDPPECMERIAVAGLVQAARRMLYHFGF